MRTALLAILILTSVARWTTAETRTADSLEWTAADAEAIVVGTVTQVTKQPGGPAVCFEGAECSPLTWYVATVTYTELIKGAIPAKQLQFAMLSSDNHHNPEAWKGRGSELLLFLVHSKRRIKQDGGCMAPCGYDKATWALRPGRNAMGVFELGGAEVTPPAVSMTFATITKRDELLATVRNAAASNATTAHGLDVPLGSAANLALYSGSTMSLFAPIDRNLEKLGQKLLTTTTDIVSRAAGVRALAHFKSPARVTQLETLLADPQFDRIVEPGKPAVRRYLVRQAAHEVLTGWGIKHVTPVIDTK